MTRTGAVVVALLAAGQSVAGQPSCDPRDSTRSHEQLTARYETILEAFMRKTVIATVEQTSDRESTDAQGVRHRLEVGALQLETWTCTTAGWRLAGVKEDSLVYLRRDGR